MLKAKIIEELGINSDEKIKTIIFDLGNVLIDIDLSRTIEGFKKLGVERFENLYTFKKQTRTFSDYETGKISTAEFRNLLRPFLKINVSDNEIDNAWMAMLTYLPKERVHLLEKLKPRYKLYLLSNTNEMHVAHFEKEADKVFGKNIFARLFEKTYYSNEVHLRKPDVEIFQYVIKDAHLNPSETLFIDDSEKNIEGARKAGLYGYCLAGKSILSLFE
jgi:HAD superfamily hydrolase (TIGR01509 family)